MANSCLLPGRGTVGKRGWATLLRHRRMHHVQKLGYVFIEIFSGREGFSRALRSRNFQCYSFDVRQGPLGDLLRPATLRRVHSLLKSGMCLGLHSGVECTTFSLASGKGYRNSEFPHGIPNLPPHIKQRLADGDQLLFMHLKILSWCRAYGVPWSWENPHSSLQWATPEAQVTSTWEGVTDHVCDYCSFGTPWRKHTRFRCSNLVNSPRLERRCSGKNGLCSYSGNRHTILQGKTSAGINLTSIASAYPKPLCELLADIHADTGFSLVFMHKISELGPLAVKRREESD